MMTPSLQSFLEQHRARIETALDNVLPNESQSPQRLHKAMRYSVLLGGKRVRPCLVYATGSIFSARSEHLDIPAAAVELIHAYSLIHDDLPAMDDDDLRRGMPTCHIAFDEATAILAGDALQTLAFQILTPYNALPLEAEQRLKLIAVLAQASGASGMVAGQAIDLDSVGKQLSASELENMHLHKTGALISASVEMGAIVAGITDESMLSKLRGYARCIGLSFQVQDDILDVEGNTDVIGKTQGADIERNKPTYVALYGLDGAKKIAASLHQEALEFLAHFDHRANHLRDFSAYIVQRDR